MFQDVPTISPTRINYPKKEESFSILSNGFCIQEDGSGEAESMIESTPTIQGGDYCLKGTRVTIQGILEAENNGRSIDEIRKGLKKYFGVDRTVEELGQAKNEYQAKAKMNTFNNELCLAEK